MEFKDRELLAKTLLDMADVKIEWSRLEDHPFANASDAIICAADGMTTDQILARWDFLKSNAIKPLASTEANLTKAIDFLMSCVGYDTINLALLASIQKTKA